MKETCTWIPFPLVSENHQKEYMCRFPYITPTCTLSKTNGWNTQYSWNEVWLFFLILRWWRPYYTYGELQGVYQRALMFMWVGFCSHKANRVNVPPGRTFLCVYKMLLGVIPSRSWKSLLVALMEPYLMCRFKPEHTCLPVR